MVGAAPKVKQLARQRNTDTGILGRFFRVAGLGASFGLVSPGFADHVSELSLHTGRRGALTSAQGR